MRSSPRAGSIEGDTLELARLFGRTFKALKQRRGVSTLPFQEAFEAESLGPRHMPVLVNVSLGGPLSVTELADRIGLSVGTTSLLVGELSRAGLVVREEDESDRRRTLVTLHEDHRKTMDAWTGQALEPLRRALRRLSPEARANFMEGWRVLDEEAKRDTAGDGELCAD
jgi:DNA-binding MarR family transcriptional regulator